MESLLCPSLVLVPRGHHFMVSRGHAMVHDVARMARFHRILLSRAGDNEHRVWISHRGGEFVKPISLACACPSRVAVLRSVSCLFYISMLRLSHGLSRQDICSRVQDRAAVGNSQAFDFSSARHWIEGKHAYKPVTGGGRGGCAASDISKGMTSLMIIYFSVIAAASLGLLIAKTSNPPGFWYKRIVQTATMNRLREQAEETPGYMDDMWIKMQIFWIRNPWCKAILALNSWIAGGVVFGMLGPQKMTFWTAYYFAISSLSTAGLEGLKPMTWESEECNRTGKNCDLSVAPYQFVTEWAHQWQFAFLGLYCFFGVPVFAWSVGSIGAFFVDIISSREGDVILCKAFSEEEFELMRLLGDGKTAVGHEDRSITLFKFVECQLLRMGKVTYEELQQIKERFMELDLDASGVVEFDELSASGGAGKNLDGDKIDPKAMKTALQYCNSQEEALWRDFRLAKAVESNTMFHGYDAEFEDVTFGGEVYMNGKSPCVFLGEGPQQNLNPPLSSLVGLNSIQNVNVGAQIVRKPTPSHPALVGMATYDNTVNTDYHSQPPWESKIIDRNADTSSRFAGSHPWRYDVPLNSQLYPGQNDVQLQSSPRNPGRPTSLQSMRREPAPEPPPRLHLNSPRASGEDGQTTQNDILF